MGVASTLFLDFKNKHPDILRAQKIEYLMTNDYAQKSKNFPSYFVPLRVPFFTIFAEAQIYPGSHASFFFKSIRNNEITFLELLF